MKRLASIAAALAFSASSAFAQTGKVEVLRLDQAAFKITTPGGKVDVLLVTHAHPDHISDAPVKVFALKPGEKAEF